VCVWGGAVCLINSVMNTLFPIGDSSAEITRVLFERRIKDKFPLYVQQSIYYSLLPAF